MKQIKVEYKGFKSILTEWSNGVKNHYALSIINPSNKEELHAGYSRKRNEKELYDYLVYYVDKKREIFMKIVEEIDDETN